MRARTLKTTILLASFFIIIVVGVAVGFLGTSILKKEVLDRAQEQVKNNLKTARTIFRKEIKLMHAGFSLVKKDTDPNFLKRQLGLDYIRTVKEDQFTNIQSEIARTAIKRKTGIGGTRIVLKDELMQWGYGIFTQNQIPLKFTPKARKTDKKILDHAMVLEFAKFIPATDDTSALVIYGGKILNKRYELVDRIRDLVFENRNYESKPIGTVTIFLDDVRIATNVLTKDGMRAIGTRVSKEVYEKVIEQGYAWFDRAFVVNDWYVTAYEPIRNIHEEIIGILYVGEIEKPFLDLTRRIIFMFFVIIAIAALIAICVTFVLAEEISRPLREMLDATCQMYGGDYHYRVKTDGAVKELNSLATSFNAMTEKLEEREQSLKVSNQKLEELNKSYLDLIGFVSHELKGILSSTILNAYAVRDGFLGMINFKQRKALDSVTRNLDYLTTTVRNYLDLSRIEKGELSVSKKKCSLTDEIIETSIEAFQKQASHKRMHVEDRVAKDFTIVADPNLMLIVTNNLIGNAIKYGNEGGLVRISARELDKAYEIEVYNEGRPLTDEEVGRLFQKFSRLNGPEGKRVQGSGLGLFITKQIVETHGGTIRVEPREAGNAFIFTIIKE